MYRIIAICVLCVLGVWVAGCATGAPQGTTSAALQSYLDYAGPPIKHFPAMGGIENWSSVDDEHVVLHTRGDKAYLVKVFRSCEDLRFAHGLRVESAMSNSIHVMDKIIVGEDTCPIREIRQIAILQMKSERAAARE